MSRTLRMMPMWTLSLVGLGPANPHLQLKREDYDEVLDCTPRLILFIHLCYLVR